MPTFGRAASSATATITTPSTNATTSAAASGGAGNGSVVFSFILALEVFSVVLVSSATWEKLVN